MAAPTAGYPAAAQPSASSSSSSGRQKRDPRAAGTGPPRRHRRPDPRLAPKRPPQPRRRRENKPRTGAFCPRRLPGCRRPRPGETSAETAFPRSHLCYHRTAARVRAAGKAARPARGSRSRPRGPFALREGSAAPARAPASGAGLVPQRYELLGKRHPLVGIPAPAQAAPPVRFASRRTDRRSFPLRWPPGWAPHGGSHSLAAAQSQPSPNRCQRRSLPTKLLPDAVTERDGTGSMQRTPLPAAASAAPPEIAPAPACAQGWHSCPTSGSARNYGAQRQGSSRAWGSWEPTALVGMQRASWSCSPSEGEGSPTPQQNQGLCFPPAQQPSRTRVSTRAVIP